MINVFILCDLFENFRKIMQQTEKKALIYSHTCNTDVASIIILLGTIQKCNIFKSVQTVHFFRPPSPPLQVYRPTFWVPQYGFHAA